jgi:hypothetical protein
MTVNAAEKIGTDGAAAPSQLFVINLCASTSPMALSHPSAPELKRYTFFVSRQRDDGRERFRLHMGYFASQDEAEAMLEAVRAVYPAAWVGPAPTVGTPRRGRAPLVTVAAPVPAVPPAVAAPVAPRAPVIASAPSPVLEAMSNVRDVLAQLSEAPEPPEPPRLQPMMRQPPAAELDAAETLRVLESPVAAVASPAPVAPIAAPAAAKVQPPRLLPAMAGEQQPEVRVVTPEDTQTLTDIRIDAENNAPPCFAVQLIWSVSPINVAMLPHLAIFDAYTLYNVEGNRQGRKWYGVRLGFFSDPNAATQVANYVRSDYTAVAIVPVATKERDRAQGGALPGTGATPRLGEQAPSLKPEAELPADKQALQGFELLQDDRPVPARRDLDDKAPPIAKVANKSVAAAGNASLATSAMTAGAPKATGKPGGKRVVVRKQPPAAAGRVNPGAATPLESTLEILGASTLSLDEGREIINDSAIRKPVNRKSANANRFSRLLSRLGGN